MSNVLGSRQGPDLRQSSKAYHGTEWFQEKLKFNRRETSNTVRHHVYNYISRHSQQGDLVALDRVRVYGRYKQMEEDSAFWNPFLMFRNINTIRLHTASTHGQILKAGLFEIMALLKGIVSKSDAKKLIYGGSFLISWNTE